MSQTLIVEPGEYAVCQLDADEPLPSWLPTAPFWTVTRAVDELSVVCSAEAVPPYSSHESGWRLLRMAGPFPFDLTGILESVLASLAAADVGILAISTFNTDYVLVKHARLAVAVAALRTAGHVVREP
ncbi:MAG: ACT domain-containing protein [Gemmatimonadota bacterium]